MCMCRCNDEDETGWLVVVVVCTACLYWWDPAPRLEKNRCAHLVEGMGEFSTDALLGVTN